VNQIYDLAKKNDRRGKGINLMLRHPESDALHVTLNTTDVKISSLLSLLAKLAHLELQVEGNTVLLVPEAEEKGRSSPRTVEKPLQKVFFVIGPRRFLKDDSIEILEVLSTSPKLEPGDRVIIRGRGHLGSHPGANLYLYTTSLEPADTDDFEQTQRKEVQKGDAYMFELSYTIKHRGFLHVSYYDLETGQGFGGVYFGSAKQMQAAEVELHLSGPADGGAQKSAP